MTPHRRRRDLHPGFQLLDAAGPTTAFEIAERFRPGSYDLTLLAPGRRPGGELVRRHAFGRAAADGPFDTIIVSGGEIVRSLAAAAKIVAWLRRTTRAADRQRLLGRLSPG